MGRCRSLSLLSIPLLGSLTLPVSAGAQRAGGHVGSAPSSAPHAAFVPSARGSFAPATRVGPASGVRYGAPTTYFPGVRGASASQGSLFLPPGITSTRPVSSFNGVRRYGNGSAGRGYGNVGYGSGYGLGFSYPGYLDFGYAGLSDDAFDPLDPNNGPNASTGNSAQNAFVDAPPQPRGAAEMAVSGEAGNFGQPAPEPSEPSESPVPYASQPPSPQRYPVPSRFAPAPLREEDAVVIVFKDGRPPEQIRNYALTRTALYVTTDRVRTIPIDDIDLAATEKANEKVGVDFQLPTR